jgi:hypothetical protein
MLIIPIFVDRHVDINNTKLFSVAKGIQQLVPFALLSNFKNISHCCQKYTLRPSSKVPDITVRL